MPKQKTSRAAKKRFKVTGAGKLLRRHAMKSHLLEKKSAKRKRRFRRQDEVSGTDAREVRRMLGLGRGRS
jgi:large subunit ribosomal protein L35